MDKILLGKIDNENIYLTKHQWDCGWYWAFGYVGNKNNHFHIDSLMQSETDVNKIFDSTKLTQAAWWAIRDLFLQAYGLKRTAEIYRYGANQCRVEGLTDVLKSQDKVNEINADLSILLEMTWHFIVVELNKPDEIKA